MTMYIIKEGQFVVMRNLIPIFEIGSGELIGDYEILNNEARYFTL
jgi:CRP-like cAMP-binding protein